MRRKKKNAKEKMQNSSSATFLNKKEMSDFFYCLHLMTASRIVQVPVLNQGSNKRNH